MDLKALSVILLLIAASTQALAAPPVDKPVCPKHAPTRFVDNGDGTVCDTFSGLMWEKKIPSEEFLCYSRNPACVSNGYSWTEGASAYDTPTGTVFTDFLRRLNYGRLAGYSDWQIPTTQEVLTLFSGPDPLGQNCVGDGVSTPLVCTDPIFGPDRGTWVSDQLLIFDPGTPRDYWQFVWPDNQGRPYVPAATPVRAVRGSMR